MAAVSPRAVVLLLVPWFARAAVPVHIFCTCHLQPSRRVIVQRTILFPTVPAPTASTSHVLVKASRIESARKNIGACCILQAPSGTPWALFSIHLASISRLFRSRCSSRTPCPPCPYQRPPFRTSSPSSRRSCPCSPARYAP